MDFKPLFALWTVGSVFLFAGCGGGGSDTPELGKVRGNVKVDGSPAKDLTVTFQPVEGRPSTGKTDQSGNYTLKYTASQSGAKVGKHIVSITSSPEATEDCSGGDGCGDEFVDPIPPKYNVDAAENPEMTKDVKPGGNEFNFDIKSDPQASAQRKKQTQRRRPSSCCDE